jgi:hypothetical protein
VGSVRSPGTPYFYAVFAAADESAPLAGPFRFVTPPTPGAPGPLRFFIIGDAGFYTTIKDLVLDSYLAAHGGLASTDAYIILGDVAQYECVPASAAPVGHPPTHPHPCNQRMATQSIDN